MIGQARITRRGVARAVLGVVVVAAAASVVYFGGRALGLGGSSPVASQGEPPVLTISLPPNCEGGQAAPLNHIIFGYDDDGNWVQTGISSSPHYHLNDLGATTLGWSIEGGTAPYELSVQGQTLLTGPTGSTTVYCAASLPVDELDFTAERFELERQETNAPAQVSPGPLTIEATVKDADGLTARARATTYVILNCLEKHCDFDVYPGGFTYRIEGFLFTIPQGLNINVRWRGGLYPACADDAGPSCQVRTILRTVGDPHNAEFHIGEETREYLGYRSNLSPEFQWARSDYVPAGTTSGATDVTPHPDADKFDQFGQSFGQRPQRPSLDGN